MLVQGHGHSNEHCWGPNRHLTRLSVSPASRPHITNACLPSSLRAGGLVSNDQVY